MFACRLSVLEEPVDCKLVQLIDKDGQACAVALVRSPAGTKHLLVNQLHTSLLQGICSPRTWQRKLEQAAGRGHQPFKKVGLLLKAKLVQLGAVNGRGVTPALVNVHTCTKAARSLGLPAAMVSALADLSASQGVQLQQATTQLMQQNAQGSPNPSTLHFAPALPVALDTSAAPVLRSRERMALDVIKPSLASSSVLSIQLQNLKEHSQLPIVVGRQGRAVNSTTWADIHREIMLFLGYIHKHFAVVHPNLEHLIRADFMAAYCCSKGARGDRGTSICKAIYAAKRVALFWMEKCPTELSRLCELRNWLGQLCTQVRQAWPSQKRNVSQLRATGKWVDAPVLLELLVGKMTEVMQTFTDLPSLSVEQARFLHDVAMACTMFGWIPPPRCSCVRTLCPPSHRGPCPDTDCKSNACWGNRVIVNVVKGTMQLHLAHHKADRKWGTIEYELPDDLTDLLVLYLSKGYKLLKNSLGVEHPFMFMSMDGPAFGTDTFCKYWQDLMDSWGGPTAGPHTLRHIFVADRSRHDTVPGPTQQGAAFCMGHDPAQWTISYDLQSLQRGAQHAVNSMSGWRAALLATRNTVQPATATPAHVAGLVDEADSDEHDDSVSEGPSCGSSETTVEDDEDEWELDLEDGV